MKKKVEFAIVNDVAGESKFKGGWEGTLKKKVPIAKLLGPHGILTNFEAGHIISNTIQGYIFPEKAIKKLLNNVSGAKIEGVAVKFGITDNGVLHLVFIPIERQNDDSYTANYDDAQTTFYGSVQGIVGEEAEDADKDPILCIPPHKA